MNSNSRRTPERTERDTRRDKSFTLLDSALEGTAKRNLNPASNMNSVSKDNSEERQLILANQQSADMVIMLADGEESKQKLPTVNSAVNIGEQSSAEKNNTEVSQPIVNGFKKVTLSGNQILMVTGSGHKTAT